MKTDLAKRESHKRYYWKNHDKVRARVLELAKEESNNRISDKCHTCQDEADAGFCPICKVATCLNCMIGKHG